MAVAVALPDSAPAPTASKRRRWGKRIGWLIALMFGPIVLAAAFFSSPIGKRFIADQIAAVAPASGLRFKVGRIEGDIYGKAVLRAVEVSAPPGPCALKISTFSPSASSTKAPKLPSRQTCIARASEPVVAFWISTSAMP